jgi:hypothetical protein
MKRTQKKSKNIKKNYTYLIKHEFLEKKDLVTNTKKIDRFKQELKKRGNWIEFNLKGPSKHIDFLYTDGKYMVDKSLYNYSKTLSSRVDMATDNHSISDKYKLLENLKKTNIDPKHLLDQYFVNLYDLYSEKDLSTYLETNYKKLFDKYKVMIFKPIHGVKGQDMETFDDFDKFKNFTIKMITKMTPKLNNINIEEYSKLGIEKRYQVYNIEWVLQEYVIDVLLYNDHKFHMRTFFVYYKTDQRSKKGFLLDNMWSFTAKKPYTKSDFGNKDIHDTHFKNSEVGIDFKDNITNLIGKENSAHVMNQIIHIFKNVFKIINAPCYQESKQCFQIFGCDLMITADLTVKIIEANYMPGSPNISIIDNIMSDIIDPIFKPKNKTLNTSPNKFIKL